MISQRESITPRLRLGSHARAREGWASLGRGGRDARRALLAAGDAGSRVS